MAEKSSSTSFHVLQAPESWLKYTTIEKLFILGGLTLINFLTSLTYSTLSARLVIGMLSPGFTIPAIRVYKCNRLAAVKGSTTSVPKSALRYELDKVR